MCVNVCYFEVCDANGVSRSVYFEIHSARVIRTCTHRHTDVSKCVILEGFESVIRCVNVCYSQVLEGFESVIRSVSTCVISKCVIQMV